MNILIFRTNISSKSDFYKVKSNLYKFPDVSNITIDLEDNDKVLPLESNNIKPQNIINTLKENNFLCEELED